MYPYTTAYTVLARLLGRFPYDAKGWEGFVPTALLLLLLMEKTRITLLLYYNVHRVLCATGRDGQNPVPPVERIESGRLLDGADAAAPAAARTPLPPSCVPPLVFSLLAMK